MKADVPQPPLVKHGLPASEQHKLIERHFALMDEHRCIDAFLYDHSIRVAPVVLAAMERDEAAPAVTVVAAPAVAAPAAPSALPVITQVRARPDNLRERLGLT